MDVDLNNLKPPKFDREKPTIDNLDSQYTIPDLFSSKQ